MKSQSPSSVGCKTWREGYKNNLSPKSWKMVRKSAVRHVLGSIDLEEYNIVDGILDYKAE